MNRKLRTLGLGLIAALALSAVVGISASAKTGGHFTSDAANTKLVGTENATHYTELHAVGQSVICNSTSYAGTQAGTTATSITLVPTYHNCETTEEDSATVTFKNCSYRFLIGEYAHEDNTTELVCPGSEKVEVHTPLCTFTFGSQKPAGGVAYTTTTISGKAAITADVTATSISYERHGLCAILGTNGSDGQLTGEVLVSGLDESNNQPTNIQATGSKGTNP